MFNSKSSLCTAQKSDFRAGLIVGLNFSELEGEEFTNYFGLNAGGFTTAQISKKTSLTVELLFSQNGEYILPEYYPDVEYGKIVLNHIELPVNLDWTFSIKKTERTDRIALSAGLAYARLIGYSAETTLGQDISDQIDYDQTSAILAQVAVSAYLTDRLSLNARISKSLQSAELDGTASFRIVYTVSKT